MTREKQIKLYKNTLKIQELLKFAKMDSKIYHVTISQVL